ncbi:MAG: HAD family hydrolase [Clostridiales bacterium]|nr:HAD family hydrolase [Clostridiales bacterium]
MQKLIIFDLDGTLLDSLPDIQDCLNKTLEKFGYKTHDRSAVMRFIGTGARNLVKKGLPEGTCDEEIDRLLKYYNEIYTNSGSPKTKLFDGVKEVVQELANRGYKMAILTNKPQITTDAIFNQYMSDMPIDLVIGQRDGVKIKPDPTVTNSILEKYGVEKQNAFFIGDGETDVITAINAGINGVAVLWGYRSKDELQDAGATIFVQKPLDLLNIL